MRTPAVVGVEFQEEMAALAQRNVELNRLAGRIEIVGDDILSLRQRFPVSSFDLVVANPPYRKPGTGRISPKAGRDTARHETTATLADFLEWPSIWLSRPEGSASSITLRLMEFCTVGSRIEACTAPDADGPW